MLEPEVRLHDLLVSERRLLVPLRRKRVRAAELSLTPAARAGTVILSVVWMSAPEGAD